MRLTHEEIEKYASPKGVKRIAVENFLGTIDTEHDSAAGCLWNCSMDAGLYRWNRATVMAIEAGIQALFDKLPSRR